MNIQANFGADPNFKLTKEECNKHNLPDVFISLVASSWLDEQAVASKLVNSVFGTIKAADSALSSINKAFLKINGLSEVHVAIRELAIYAKKHYQKKNTIRRFNHFFNLLNDEYSLEKAKQETTNIMIRENYKIHGSLAAKTADGIMEAAGVSGNKEEDGDESDDSCASEKYHPKRSRKYSANAFNDDDQTTSDNSIMMKELKEFRLCSIELTKNDAIQVSDLRLLSLDCIYLFSEDIKYSVSKYLGTQYHNTLVPTFIGKKPSALNPVVFTWCMTLSNFNFNDSNNKWMELQAATINMLSEAINTNDKVIVQIANLLHTIAPRLFISTSDLNVEDTFGHTVFSYAIKLIFGTENLLMHQWANGRLNQQNENDHGKFKPDYIAFVKVRCTRHDIAITEVKPTGTGSGRPPSDLVKLGQQMKVMLNNLINYRVDSPIVCGILVEGKCCSLYKMDLIGLHFYRMVLLSSFSLCTSSSEMFLIPNMFLCLNSLKNIAVDTAKKVEQNELVRAKGKRLFEDPIPVSWIHNSTCKFSMVKESDNLLCPHL